MEQSQPAPEQPPQPPEPRKRKPLTPRQRRNRFIQEAAIVFLIALWFIYDGWFSTTISESGRSFSRLGAVVLVCWFANAVYNAVKFHRAALREPSPPEQQPTTPP